MPVGMNRKLGPNDRCSLGGGVITAFLSAVVEGIRLSDGSKIRRSLFERCNSMALWPRAISVLPLGRWGLITPI